MKSLILIRSPLFKRKRLLGILKTKKKVLGEILLNTNENSINRNNTIIYCSTFSKAKAAGFKLCKTHNLSSDEVLRIHPMIQDLDDEKCIDLLSSLPMHIENVCIIAPSVTVSNIFSAIENERVIFKPGEAKKVCFQVNNWDELRNSSLSEAHISTAHCA